MTDPYAYWYAALAGEPVQRNEGNPQAGFYRWPKKAAYGARKTFKAVAYWPEGDEMKCSVDGVDVSSQYGADIWVSVGAHPIEHEDYLDFINTGKWPDEPDNVPMGSNQAPDDNSYEGLKEAITDLARDANKLLVAGEVPKTQTEADAISNLADRLAELGKKAEDQRKAEKAPHDEAAEKVQLKWKPLIITSEVYKGLKNRLLAPFLSAQAKLAKEEALISGTEPPRPKAGTRGRAMTMRVYKTARIVDRDKVLEHFKNAEMISNSLQILADRAVKAGEVVPGVEVITEDKVI